MRRREQGSTLFAALLWMIGTGVAFQLWLLTLALEAYLGHRRDALAPAAVASYALFLLNAGLLLFILRLDRRIRRERR